MSELSERARDVAYALQNLPGRDSMTVQQLVQARDAVIEQALLRERRLAMELSVEIIRKYLAFNDQRAVSWHEIQDTITALRAAAEKEVGK